MPTFKSRNGISFLLYSWVNLFIFCEFLERVWYIMRHTWYCLTQHSSICSSPTLLTLVRHPHHLRQHTNHLTHAGTPSHHASKHATHATLASTPPTSHTPESQLLFHLGAIWLALMLECFVGKRLPLCLWKSLAFATCQDLVSSSVLILRDFVNKWPLSRSKLLPWNYYLKNSDIKMSKK